MIRVGVLGAAGKMGRVTCAAVEDDPELDLVAAIDPSHADLAIPVGTREIRPASTLDELLDAEAQVAVDFTRPDAVMVNIRYLVEHGIHGVVGTTGIRPEDFERISAWIEGAEAQVGLVVAPNFAIGAVVGQRLAEEAARFFPDVEIVELHHAGKLDAPSGTAAATARRIAAARTRDATRREDNAFRGGDVEGVRVHSIRLPGLIAHQEVIFGAQGQTLTIRHDAPDRTSYMPGVLLAIREVMDRPGLTVGLEPLLGL